VPDSPSPTPSADAVAQLRAAAAELDVFDVVDLAFSGTVTPLRLGIYLDALRGRGGDRAQAAACLLLFELLRLGDEAREPELWALAPVLDGLMADESIAGEDSTIAGLVDGHPLLTTVWSDLKAELVARDRRLQGGQLPLWNVVQATGGGLLAPGGDDPLDAIEIEVDLFADGELAEIELELDELDRVAGAVDDEARAAFDRAFNAHVPQPPTVLLAVDDAAGLTRVQALRDVCRSFSDKVGIAAELDPMLELFLAAHTRGTGFLGRRNKERDRWLHSGLTRFAALAAPPAEASVWLDPTEIPLAPAAAWPKVAEILLDYLAFLGGLAPPGHDVGGGGAAVLGPSTATAPPDPAAAYVAAPRSKAPPPRVLCDGEGRRRR
jgi:hypothetical protein